MELCVKTFEQLTKDELYDLLQARAAVFVVEQTCPYQDLDGMDREATHVFLRDEAGIAACLRFFSLDARTVKIGRVLTTRRGTGLGSKLLAHGIEAVKKLEGVTSIYIEAQTYAVGFYEKSGFRTEGPEFLEDGIPHIGMRLKL